MSDKTQTPELATVPTDEQPQESKFAALKRRVVTPIKNHPKIATAVGLGVVLVGAAAFAGKAEDPTPELFDGEYTDEPVEPESDDTNVA